VGWENLGILSFGHLGSIYGTSTGSSHDALWEWGANLIMRPGNLPTVQIRYKNIFFNLMMGIL